MSARRLVSLALVALVAGACGGSGSNASPVGPSSTAMVTSSTTTTTTVPVETGSVEIGPADRRAQLVAPDEVTVPAPLLVLLHGYTSDAAQQDAYLGVTAQAASRGLYVLLPNGTTAPGGERFWDASPACCNFTGSTVDDVGYLGALIDEAIEARPIDPERVFLFGHSNGGFMSYRMACERAEQIAGIAVLAGADLPEVDDCEPSEPVSVLHLHGTDDELVLYDGGQFAAAPFPGALESVTRWAERIGCDAEPVARDSLDLEAGIDGAETVVTRFVACDDGSAVQLDSIEGGRHVPRLDPVQVGVHVLDWLLDQAR